MEVSAKHYVSVKSSMYNNKNENFRKNNIPSLFVKYNSLDFTLEIAKYNFEKRFCQQNHNSNANPNISFKVSSNKKIAYDFANSPPRLLKFNFESSSDQEQEFIITHESTKIKSMILAYNDEYVFLGTENSSLFQFSTLHKEIIKRYTINGALNLLSLTNDDKTILIGKSNGYVVQFSIQEKDVIRGFGKLIDGKIYMMNVTPDSKY